MSKEQYNIELLEASKDGNLQNCIKAIEKGADVNATDICDLQPIHYASNSGDLEVVKYLVELQKVSVTTQDTRQLRQPLHYATRSGNLEIVKYLLGKGASVEAVDICNTTPLHHASMCGNLEIVKYLHKKGANVKAKDTWNNTPLHFASGHGYLELVKYLAELDLVSLNAENIDLLQPIHRASNFGHLETVKYLHKKGANVNAEDKRNNTPLRYASNSGYLEVAKYLIENNANVNAEGLDKTTPLISCSWRDIKTLLIENGAIVTQDMIDQARNQQSYLLTHLVTAQWCQDILSNQPSYQDIRAIPVDLIQRVMKGQLKLIGSIEKLLEVKTIQNEIIQEIFTEDFVSEVTDKIVIKHKVPELYKAMLKGEPYNGENLQNLPESSQKLLVQELKSLCAQRGITSYGNAAGVMNSSTIPDYVKTAINKALTEGKNALEVVESSIMNSIYPDQDLVPTELLTKYAKETRPYDPSTDIRKTFLDLTIGDMHSAQVRELDKFLTSHPILPSDKKKHLENLIDDVKDLAARTIQKMFHDYSARQEMATKFDQGEGFAGQEMDVEPTGQTYENGHDLP